MKWPDDIPAKLGQVAQVMGVINDASGRSSHLVHAWFLQTQALARFKAGLWTWPGSSANPRFAPGGCAPRTPSDDETGLVLSIGDYGSQQLACPHPPTANLSHWPHRDDWVVGGSLCSTFKFSRVSKVMSVNGGLLAAFFTLHGVAAWGGLILLVTAVVARSAVRRQNAWYNFIFSWVFLSTSFSLLLFGHKRDPEPPFSLCLAQAVMRYGALPLVSGTTVALVTQVYFNIRNWVSNSTPGEVQKHVIWMLLLAPWIVAVVVSSACVAVGLSNPDRVRREGFYCIIQVGAVFRAVNIFVAALMLPTVVLNATTLYYLRGNWHLLRGSVLRVLVFSISSVVAMVMGLIFATSSGSPLRGFDVVTAGVAASAILIFATQGVCRLLLAAGGNINRFHRGVTGSLGRLDVLETE
ncbi:hypothetical protein CC1G_11528 [Coprinopsis cinerea okayama7|uniref:G-protein coupled receptors family 2 profile 2 domain-containing protein n=1 Tax=Coprinopsis cinerea (strain Okayama-7 / 130 / ATCC MYA-4618 / FGSC 9003) TaxID=240176 RepID=A8NHD7_COPC7|nr:hypothetical protein CC1G_11528 [Coprinopsis cinerea okayama7\|eukprot:XP_001833743.2 hypothetical protein CC1G_11528 [Coprinopsis cinerea okayama7\